MKTLNDKRLSKFLYVAVGVLLALLGVVLLAPKVNQLTKRPDVNPYGHFATREETRMSLGSPASSLPVEQLPIGYRKELASLGLTTKLKSFDKFTEFRGSSSVARGIYWIYVIYDGDGKVVYSFKQFVD